MRKEHKNPKGGLTAKGRAFREKSKKDIRTTVFEKAQLEARYLLREKRAAKEEEMEKRDKKISEEIKQKLPVHALGKNYRRERKTKIICFLRFRIKKFPYPEIGEFN